MKVHQVGLIQFWILLVPSDLTGLCRHVAFGKWCDEVGKCVQNQRFHGSDFINIFGHQFLWILWNTVSRIHKFVGNGFTNTCCCHAHFLLQWPFDFVDQLNNKSWCLTNIDDTLYHKKQCKLVIKSKDYFLEEDIWFLFSYLDFFLRAASL